MLAIGLCASAIAQQRSVLFIGNSYTSVNDLPNTFRQLALSLGDTVNVAASDPGGYTFQMQSAYMPTLNAIASQAWDYVVLQEQSQIPSFPQSQVETECYPYAAVLVDSILANDTCTQPVFYMTWGRQNGDADNCDTWPPVCTYDGMQAELRFSYLQMAQDNDAFAAPVGMAWKHVRDTHPLINLYNADQSHPSPEGTYLAASVFYSTIFRASSAGATFVSALDPDTAAILRDIASSTVLDSMSTWNIGVNDPDASFTTELEQNYTVLFMYGGTGTSYWDFGDETYSDASSSVHYYQTGSPWTFDVTHTVTDACGRTNTVTQQVTVVMPQSISGNEPPDRISARMRDDELIFSNLLGTDDVLLTDALGRIISRPSSAKASLGLTCGKGLTIWRVTDKNGRSITGRVIIP